MNRRGFLSCITAGVGASTISSVAASGARTTGQSNELGVDDFQRVDWVPHTTIDVAQDGRATVSVSLEGDESPETFRLDRRNSTDVEITQGADAIEPDGNTFVWDSTVADELEYTVQLGHMATGSSTFGVFENCIVGNTAELLLMIDWTGTSEAMPQKHRFTFEPPSGWSAVTGGNKVGENTFESDRRYLFPSSPHEIIVVGDVTAHTRTVDDTAVRVVSMPTADGPDADAILDEYEDVLPRYEEYFGHETMYEKLCVIVTNDVEPQNGGQAFANSCLVNQTRELVGVHDTYIQELAALYIRTRVPRWIQNGFRSYIQRVALWDAGLISEEKLYDDVQANGSHGGEPIRQTVGTSTFDKGSAVCAALDMDIRARTDGEATIADWRGALNDRENEFIPDSFGGENRGVSRDTSLAVLEDITGENYAGFYGRYVDGPEYPTEVLSDDFSLTDPVTVTMATLEVRSSEVSATELYRGEELAVTIEVANTGDAPGSRTVELQVDDAVVASREVALDPGASDTVTLRHVFEQGGRQTIQLPDESERQIVVRRPYETENVELSDTDLVVGDSVRVTVDVSNIADIPTTVDFTLEVEGGPVRPTQSSKTIDLAVGETAQVTFRHTFETIGAYDINLNERHVGVVDVGPIPDETATADGQADDEAASGDGQADDGTTAADGQADDETASADGQADDKTTSGDGAGFGIVSGAASIGGGAYLLSRRVSERENDDE